MNEIDPNSLLIQMRALAARMEKLSAPAPGVAEAGGASFGGVFKQALDQVNATQVHAAKLAAAVERGDPNTNIAEVMVALQKADISFQAIAQVRNRLVSAYQEIMNMPI
jgi:flagellar hook-basal body complex protein FliE